MLYHLGYVSTETDAMAGQDLLALLAQAHSKNRSLQITGVLLHRQDSFFQVLEGEQGDVQALFDTIRRDSRHQRIEVLFEGEIEAREFPDWRMSFIELDGVDVDRLPGFSEFLLNKAEPRRLFEGLTESRRLMLLFKAMK